LLRYLVMEVCPGVDFCKYLRDTVAFADNEAARLIGQLLSACQFLLSFGLVHRDIKLANIIYDAVCVTKKDREVNCLAAVFL